MNKQHYSILMLTALFALVSPALYAIDMKVDRVTVNTPTSGSTVTWSTVTFQQTFGAIPVVVVLPTNTNPEPATVRIRNVSTTGFEVGVVEPPGADGQTTEMTVDYFAAETGVYTFPGAIRMVVGAYSTDTRQGRFASGTGWDDVNFPISFGSAPAVVAEVQTINSQPSLGAGDIGSPFLEVAIRNVTSNDMDMALERAETSTGTLIAETIGYIAMESGDEVSLSGEEIKAVLTPDNVSGWDNGCYVRSYSSSFASTPLVVASQNSRDGGDGGWVRRCSISSSGVGLTIDEDQADDSDRSHTTEEVGVLAISGPFHGTRNGRDIEAGSVTILATSEPTQWTAVSFPNTFSVTPHVFALATDEGVSPADIRVRNITTSGFEMAAFQPSGGNGVHPPMEVDYVAIIPGDHTLANGDVFEVGNISTDRYQGGTGGSTGTVDINFNENFGGGAAVLLQIQSQNNEPTLDPNSVSDPWLTTAVTDLTSSLIEVALDRAETSVTGTPISSPETIAYFAVQDGTNDSLNATDGSAVDYEMFVTPDNIFGFTDGCYNNNYADSYATPYAIATQSSRDGNNGGWVRRCNLESTRIGLTIDEDQTNDSERSHTSEEASVFVFSRAFEASFNIIDHYAIFHSGTGVTCESETITIAARDAANIGVEAGGRTITVTATSTSSGWSASDTTWTLVSGTGTFSTPSAGVAQYIFATAESSVELALANVSSADIDIDVVDADPSITDRDGDALDDPILSFLATGFRFYNDSDGDGNADGTDPIDSPLIAGSTSGQFILRGVQTNTSSGACETRVSGTQSVSMAYECINPLSCIRTRDMEVNGVAIRENDAGSTISYDTVNLIFDADGEAPFTIEYFDAGAVRLHAELFVAADGSNPAVTLNGTSDETIVKPANLVITEISDGSGQNNTGTDSFVISDTTFTVVVQAQNADGGTTPNFGQEIAPERIAVVPESLVVPASGDLPAFSAADTFNPTSTGGEFENTVVRWPEAGVITMRAELLDGDYLGTGTVGSPVTGNVGRFYPDHLRLASSTVSNGCAGGFTYMSDQLLNYTPIDLSYSVEAVTPGLSRLQNYDGTYPVVTLSLDAENADSGDNIVSRFGLPSGTWSDGLFSVSGTDNSGFARALVSGNEAPDGPYSSVQLGIKVSGSNPDNVDFQTSALDMDAASTGDCALSSTCTAVAIGSTLNMVFGRLATEGTHGPETASLTPLFEAQIWDAVNGFTRNTSDTCTIIEMSDISFDGNTLASDANRTVSVGSGTSTGTFNNFTPGVRLALSSGDAGLIFSPPGAGNTGSFNVDVDLSNYPWLRSDWNSNDDSADDTALPSAEITFGRYRGHDRVIYWEEVF